MIESTKEQRLFMAIYRGDERRVSELLEEGADPNARDHGGRTPFQYAAVLGRGVIALDLLAAGADPSALTPDGFSCLPAAARLDEFPEMLPRLIAAGADIDAANSEGMTPLHYAALAGNDEALVMLADRGADLDARDVDGRSAGDLARSDDARRLLAEARADREARAFDALTSPCADEPAKETRRRRL